MNHYLSLPMTNDRCPIANSGADEYIEKPFNLEELANRVRDLMEAMAV